MFIALNEYNQVPEGERKDFIMASILKNYGGDDRESFTAAEVKKTMKTPLTVGSEIIPSIVLLLDGFNEITVKKKELLLELNHLVEQCPGIQVVITSRYDMRGNFNWGHWNLVRLRELEEEKVDAYLQGKGLAVPGPGRLWGLLGNPMMLTLYAASCEVQAYQKNSRYCCFKETVETTGELLWNFIEAQVAKLPDRVGPDEGQVVYYWFLLKYLLPGLGYEMEKQGLFDFTNAQFPGFPPNHEILITERNKIYVPDTSDQGKSRELINIPGLFIQGCSFQNLEKGSEWTEEGVAILKQYHTRF